MNTVSLTILLDQLLQIGFDAVTVRLQIRKAAAYRAEPLPEWASNLAGGLDERLRFFELLPDRYFDEQALRNREQARRLVDRTLADLSSLSH